MEAPTPFLMGLHTSVSLEGWSLEHVVIVDLDRWAGRAEGLRGWGCRLGRGVEMDCGLVPREQQSSSTWTVGQAGAAGRGGEVVCGVGRAAGRGGDGREDGMWARPVGVSRSHQGRLGEGCCRA